MVKTAVEYPPGVSKFEVLHLEAIDSVNVKPLRLLNAFVAIKCKVTQIVSVEGTTNTMVLGKVLRFHVRDNLYRFTLGLVDTAAMKPITRLGGPIEYAKIGELLHLKISEA